MFENLNDVLHAQTVKPLGMHLTRLIPCTSTHVIRVSGYTIRNVIHTNTRMCNEWDALHAVVSCRCFAVLYSDVAWEHGGSHTVLEYVSLGSVVLELLMLDGLDILQGFSVYSSEHFMVINITRDTCRQSCEFLMKLDSFRKCWRCLPCENSEVTHCYLMIGMWRKVAPYLVFSVYISSFFMCCR